MNKFYGLTLSHGIFFIFILGNMALCLILGYKWGKHQISKKPMWSNLREGTNVSVLANSLQEPLNHIHQ